MSLKINKVGSVLTNYTYAVDITNNNTLFATIKYQSTANVEKIRVYEINIDDRHSNLQIIRDSIKYILDNSIKNNVVIREDSQRNYIIFDYNKKTEQYTGKTIV